ncbi:hypothetical protein FAI40_01545 [Acetobacteraceae bacterium]|nr:hypothetical protein FAI40_01545 [Acetobacteraceae bacterium]
MMKFFKEFFVVLVIFISTFLLFAWTLENVLPEDCDPINIFGYRPPYPAWMEILVFLNPIIVYPTIFFFIIFLIVFLYKKCKAKFELLPKEIGVFRKLLFVLIMNFLSTIIFIFFIVLTDKLYDNCGISNGFCERHHYSVFEGRFIAFIDMFMAVTLSFLIAKFSIKLYHKFRMKCSKN